MNTWRKVRVVVEVPVRGEFTEKDLAWEVKATTEYDAKFLKRRYGLSYRATFGRAVVKEYSRFARAKRAGE
jgi:hypothetical protein